MRSFLEYLRAVARHIYLLIVGAVGAVLTVVSLVAPTVIRIAGLSLLAFGVLGAQFLAWVEMRMERDTARERELEVVEKVSSRSLHFTEIFAGVIGLEEHPSNAAVQLEIGLRNFGSSFVHYRVVSTSVVLAGKTAPALFDSNSGDIPPGATGGFRYPAIDGLDVTRDMEGVLEFTVQYGHPDLPPAREMHHRYRLLITGSVVQTSPLEQSDVRI